MKNHKINIKNIYLYILISQLALFLCNCINDAEKTDATGQKKDSIKVSNTEATESYFIRNENNNGIIIFMHGINGNAKATWESKNPFAYFPEIVSKDTIFKSFDIFSFGYKSGALDITETSEKLRLGFETHDLYKYDKIIFVCHSMGGLVTREFLNNHRDYNGLASKVKLIYCYSTPAQGSQVAAWGRNFSKNPALKDMTPEEGERILGSIIIRWLDSRLLTQIPSCAAYERLTTHHVMVVDRFGAIQLANRPVDPLEYNHIEMVKPFNRNDDRYMVFRSAFKRENLDKIPSSKPIIIPPGPIKPENRPIITDNNREYKEFLKVIISKLAKSKTDYEDYHKNDRDCAKLKLVYQNNISTLSTMRNQFRFVQRAELQDLLAHLESWTNSYEAQFQKNTYNETGCAVNYKGRAFPDGVEKRLIDILAAL